MEEQALRSDKYRAVPTMLLFARLNSMLIEQKADACVIRQEVPLRAALRRVFQSPVRSHC